MAGNEQLDEIRNLYDAGANNLVLGFDDNAMAQLDTALDMVNAAINAPHVHYTDTAPHWVVRSQVLSEIGNHQRRLGTAAASLDQQHQMLNDAMINLQAAYRDADFGRMLLANRHGDESDLRHAASVCGVTRLRYGHLLLAWGILADRILPGSGIDSETEAVNQFALAMRDLEAGDDGIALIDAFTLTMATGRLRFVDYAYEEALSDLTIYLEWVRTNDADNYAGARALAERRTQVINLFAQARTREQQASAIKALQDMVLRDS